MPIAISKRYTTGTFGPSPTLDQKIDIFRDRVMGWQIEVAEEMADQMRSVPDESPMKHAGFALISVLFSYFEMVAQFQNGKTSHSKSYSFFIDGFKSVYQTTQLPDATIGGIYTRIRCGMYHSAITHPSVLISDHRKPTFVVESKIVYLNPIELVSDIKAHFLGYVSRLLDVRNANDRANFEAVFDLGASYYPGLHDQGNLFSGAGFG